MAYPKKCTPPEYLHRWSVGHHPTLSGRGPQGSQASYNKSGVDLIPPLPSGACSPSDSWKPCSVFLF
eukprot:6389180-Pyramimonas_sp.AAC.1